MIYHETEHGSLYCGNCLDILPTLADNSVDLTITSPPYDNLRDYKGYSFDFEGIAKELFRVTKKGGVVVWVVGDATINGSESGTSFKQALYFKEIGFNLYDTMIWHKTSIPLNHHRYEQEFEYMFIISKGSPNTFNPIMERKLYKDNRLQKSLHRHKDKGAKTGYASRAITKIKGNIWKINTGGGLSTKDKIAYQHPAIFPEQLASDHIYSWSNAGDIVLDCFMGSGTTAKMAIRAGRKYIGIDISQEYCAIAARRIEAELDQTTITLEEL